MGFKEFFKIYSDIMQNDLCILKKYLMIYWEHITQWIQRSSFERAKQNNNKCLIELKRFTSILEQQK